MEIEAMCGIASYFDDRNAAATYEKIDTVSVALFSLSYWCTAYDDFAWDDDEARPSEEQWDAMLANAMKPYDITRPFWEALGWDITDGHGRELACAHFFAEQIIIAESGWIEGVQLSLDGSGTEPVHEGPELSEEELTHRLACEAETFLLRQNRRR
jgi:hypothetical protein